MGFMRGAIDRLKRKPSVNHLVAPSIASDDAYSDAPPYNQPYPGPVGMDGTRIPRGMNPGGTYGNNARYGSASGRANLNPIMESDSQHDPHYTIPSANGNRRPGPSPTAPHQYQQPPPQQQPYGQYPSTPTTPGSGHPGSSNGSSLSGTTQETGYTRYSGDSYRAPPPPPNTNNTRSAKPTQQPPQQSSAVPNPQDFADPKASTAEVRRCIGLLRKLYRLKMSTWSRQRVHIAVQHKRVADRRKAEDLLRDIHQIVHDWRTIPPGNWSPQEQEEINFISQNLSMLQPFWDEGPPESAGPGAGYGGQHGVPHGASYGRPVFR